MTSLAAIAFPPLDPVAVQIGPLSVRWYGLAYVAGFVAAGLILYVLARRWDLGLTGDDATLIVLAAVIGVVLGGRLGYVLFYGGATYLRNPLEILRVWDGGMSFHGGLVGILVAGVVVSRVLKMPFLTVCDLGAVGAPLGLFFGRIANFINGELWGRTTNVPWAVVFPGAGPIGRHPSQIYEALLEGLVIFAVLMWMAWRLPPPYRGKVLGWCLTLYAVFRTFVELFREPDAQIGFLPGGITMGQLLSVPVLLAGVALIVWSGRAKKPQLGPAREDQSSGSDPKGAGGSSSAV